VRAQLALHFVGDDGMWAEVTRYDSIAAELADGHYSRQSPGDDKYLAPGKSVAYAHRGTVGRAVWGVVYNVFKDVWRWRNSIFRNLSGTLSSALIEAATTRTYRDWLTKYGQLPDVPLITEVDIDATSDRRGRNNPPGYCYECAGWTWVRTTLEGHGRSRKAIYEAPRG
jgi:hypothetical protein